MTLNEARELVYSTFITEWASETPFLFDNESFKPNTAPDDNPWVRLVVRNKTSSQETLGKKNQRRFERKAMVLAQVFTKVDIGTSEGDRLCQKVRCIFEGNNINGIWFLEGTVREVGPDGAWFQMIVQIDFNYEERK